MEEAFVVSHPFIVKPEGSEESPADMATATQQEAEDLHRRLGGAEPVYRLPPKIRAVLEALDEFEGRKNILDSYNTAK